MQHFYGVNVTNNFIRFWHAQFIAFIVITFFYPAKICFATYNLDGIQVYQKNMQLSIEHKLRLENDISRYRNADNLWDVLREEFSLAHYEDHPAVQEKIDWYMNNQDYLLRSAMRAAPYLYYILQQVKKRHLPAELVLLPIIESGYNPFSISHVGAAGIWQLMPATAAELGLRQDLAYDGRRDVISSTHAALDHLAYLESIYDGNWLLAFAAYDTGEGNVRAAMIKNIRNGLDTDFWSLPVAMETKNYVPSLLALAVIISHPELYPVNLPAVQNAPYLAQIDIGTPMNLKYAALLAGISYKKLMQLNPGYSRPTTPNQGPYKLILPIENVAQFTENLLQAPVNLHAERTTPSSVSIPHKSLYPIKKIIINDTKASSANYSLQPGDTIYMVRTGDTIETIANRFHISSNAIRIANFLQNNSLKTGERIVVPTHLQG